MKLCSKCGVDMEERYSRFGEIEILCEACAAEEPTLCVENRKNWQPWMPAGMPYPEPKNTVRG